MSSSNEFALGIDVGGTTIKAALVDRNGSILERSSIDSCGSEGPAVVIGEIVRSCREILDKYPQIKCRGIGIGCPGVVSLDGDTVQHPPNLIGWNDVRLASAITKEIPLPVRVENDANVAALAEARFGAGKDVKDFLFVIWGTGVGGGIIIDHQIFHGPSGGAGEIGHMTINFEGPQCNCGAHGCIESYIGQRYLSERTKQLLLDGKSSSFIERLVDGNLDKIEPSIIAEAATQGDRIARMVLEEAGTQLGYALASALNILDLESVVIGGGISAAPQFVYDAIRLSICSRVLMPHRSNINVLRATLGNSAGVVGAASLMF